MSGGIAAGGTHMKRRPEHLRAVGETSQLVLPDPEATHAREQAVVSALCLDPSQRSAVEEIVAPQDFLALPCRVVYEALLSIQNPQPDFGDIVAALEARGTLKAAGGDGGVSELVGVAATAATVLRDARRVRHDARVRELAKLLDYARSGSPFDRERLLALDREIFEESGEPETYLPKIATPDELRALSEEPPTVPLVSHLLYPAATTVFAGDSGMGKTTAMLRALVDLAYGREPWTGNTDGRPRRRCLLISMDDTTKSLQAKVGALAPDEDWMDGRISLVGKEKHPWVLDSDGARTLERSIEQGRFDVAVVDPLEHFLPEEEMAGVNNDQMMKRILRRMESIALSTDACCAIVHHLRKRPANAKNPLLMTKQERMNEIRGSGVIAQLARVVATLWETEPGMRMLDCMANDAPPLAEIHFQTTRVGEFGIRWEVSEAPTDSEFEVLKTKLWELDYGFHSWSGVARHLFDLPEGKTPSGPRRGQAKRVGAAMAERHPERFMIRRVGQGGLEVHEGMDPDGEVML